MIEQIVSCKSHFEPLVQIADLYAGLSVYSRESFNCYQQWQLMNDNQQRLFSVNGTQSISLSTSDKERCIVLTEFNNICKRCKLGVSLETNKGLKTFNPKYPINFWWYKLPTDKEKGRHK
ncbi:MAG: hypothetical protein QME64_02610 [bacterium]|nr:hypothetical protein [bacterium]